MEKDLENFYSGLCLNKVIYNESGKPGILVFTRFRPGLEAGKDIETLVVGFDDFDRDLRECVDPGVVPPKDFYRSPLNTWCQVGHVIAFNQTMVDLKAAGKTLPYCPCA
jgi:hypothetical protein